MDTDTTTDTRLALRMRCSRRKLCSSRQQLIKTCNNGITASKFNIQSFHDTLRFCCRSSCHYFTAMMNVHSTCPHLLLLCMALGSGRVESPVSRVRGRGVQGRTKKAVNHRKTRPSGSIVYTTIIRKYSDRLYIVFTPKRSLPFRTEGYTTPPDNIETVSIVIRISKRSLHFRPEYSSSGGSMNKMTLYARRRKTVILLL